MANKYANLVGTNKIKDEYTKINTGFDRVEADINKLKTDVTAVNTRVDTIITTPISGAAATQEIVDARVSAVKSKTFATLDARFEETEQDIATHRADRVYDSDGAHGLKVESGTFTPTIIGLTTTGNNTYSSNHGYYEKIDRTVIFHIFILMTAKDPAMEGIVRIAGLPFVARPEGGRHNSISIGSYSNIVTAGKQLGGYIQDNHATIAILLSGNNIVNENLYASGINNNTLIRLSGIYQTF